MQTNTKVIERCLLMTTDPGDLVLDPTCGSGTTAYVAEQWGRRWITIDTSRVAVAIARQRLLTAKFDYYRLRDEKAGVAGELRLQDRPAHHPQEHRPEPEPRPDLRQARADPRRPACRPATRPSPRCPTELRRRLRAEAGGQGAAAKASGAVTDADRRRWQLARQAAQTLGALDGPLRHRPRLAEGAAARP